MNWSDLFIVFFACHLAGDFLFQTDWQATTKVGGLGKNRQARKALFAHLFTYTISFTPAFIWIGIELGAVVALISAAVVFLPHLIIDDRRLTIAFMRKVKGTSEPEAMGMAGLVVAVDQSFHLICLFLTALLVASL